MLALVIAIALCLFRLEVFYNINLLTIVILFYDIYARTIGCGAVTYISNDFHSSEINDLGFHELPNGSLLLYTPLTHVLPARNNAFPVLLDGIDRCVQRKRRVHKYSTKNADNLTLSAANSKSPLLTPEMQMQRSEAFKSVHYPHSISKAF